MKSIYRIIKFIIFVTTALFPLAVNFKIRFISFLKFLRLSFLEGKFLMSFTSHQFRVTKHLLPKNYRSKQKPFFSLFHKQLLACKKQTIAIKSESFHLKLRELYVQSCFLSKLYFFHFQ